MIEIIFVVDRTGSMVTTPLRERVEAGVWEIIDRQRALPGDHRVSLYQIDAEFGVVIDGELLSDVSREDCQVEHRGTLASPDAFTGAISDAANKIVVRGSDAVVVVLVACAHHRASPGLKLASLDPKVREWAKTTFGPSITNPDWENPDWARAARDEFGWTFILAAYDATDGTRWVDRAARLVEDARSS